MNKQTLKEALFFGLILTVLGVAIHMIYSKYYSHDMNDTKKYGLHLFVTGVLAHLLFEYFEVNKWYCKNGNACLEQDLIQE